MKKNKLPRNFQCCLFFLDFFGPLCIANFRIYSEASLWEVSAHFRWSVHVSVISSRSPPCVFFFISLTFSCICERANDSLTGMLSDRWCLSSGGASALSWELVCARVCRKSGGIVRTGPAHFACSPRDRCFWASTGAWQLPFIAVFSTLNPWPALPSSSCSSSSVPSSSLPFFSMSDLLSRRFPLPS